jgi:hypothetical protein
MFARMGHSVSPFPFPLVRILEQLKDTRKMFCDNVSTLARKIEKRNRITDALHEDALISASTWNTTA